jgi:hypothetical protein
MRSTLLPVLALGWALALPEAARAAIATAESLDWVVADSDRVVMGKVVKVDQALHKDGTVFEVVTVAVSRTFKGKHAPQARFAMRGYRGLVARNWLADGEPLLFGLVTADRARNGDWPPLGARWALRDDGNDFSAVLLGKRKRYWTFTIDVITRDFNIVHEPAAIIKEVEDFLRSLPPGWQKKSLHVSVPGGTPALKKLYAGSAVFLKVPVDPRLERMARQWCRSNRVWLRMEGAGLLGLFKNEENVRILKSLLNDPGYYFTNRDVQIMGTTHPGHVRVYGARRAAYNVLRGFGVAVEEPHTEEPVRR